MPIMTDTVLSPFMATASLIPAAAPPRPADRITSDADALDVAQALAGLFAPGAQHRDANRVLPWTEIERLSSSGLGSITVPRAHGGADVSAWTLAQVIATLAQADGSIGQIPQNHFYALEVLRVTGSPAQQRFFFERALRGERLGNALAEIGHKDYQRRTRLVRDPAGWYVEGSKFYCTGAIFAHWIPTLVVVPEEDGNTYLVFIPRDAPGVSIQDDWDGIGQRVTGSGSVQFARVHVEPAWVIPFKAGFDTPSAIGPVAQIMHAAIDLGIGRAALAALLTFVREHARPWPDAGVERASQDPLTVAQIGEVHVRLRSAAALLRRAGAVVDAARDTPSEESVAAASVAVAQARVLTTTAGLLAANKLLELGGTSATLGQHGLDRHWRNVRTHTLHDPVRWKYHAVGNFHLNGRKPPRHGTL